VGLSDKADWHVLNDGYRYRERLGPDADGVPLVDYLASRYAHSSRAAWTERIERGRVLIDADTANPETILRRGQTLVWNRPPWTEPDAPLTFDVLFEDDQLLAAAKPAGLPTLPGAGFLNSTLLFRVRRLFPEAAPLHRLGRWTSGVVLFSRTREAHADLSSQWASRSVGKRYRALASGRASSRRFTIDTPIGPVAHPLLGSIHAASAVGKAAISRVRLLEQRRAAFLCDVEIETGRPHQIRIHLAAAGHPLLGDPLYPAGGVPAASCAALPGDPGYELHAAELSFRHPRTRREVVVGCAPPELLCVGSRRSSPMANPPRF